jgi:hypothetical protein
LVAHRLSDVWTAYRGVLSHVAAALVAKRPEAARVLLLAEEAVAEKMVLMGLAAVAQLQTDLNQAAEM